MADRAGVLAGGSAARAPPAPASPLPSTTSYNHSILPTPGAQSAAVPSTPDVHATTTGMLSSNDGMITVWKSPRLKRTFDFGFGNDVDVDFIQPTSRTPGLYTPSQLLNHIEAMTRIDTSSTFFHQIKGLPKVREVEFRSTYIGEGDEAGMRSLNIGNTTNLMAVLAQSKGSIETSPCEGCLASRGPFKECITLKGKLAGACGNCYYDKHAAQCSLQKSK